MICEIPAVKLRTARRAVIRQGQLVLISRLNHTNRKHIRRLQRIDEVDNDSTFELG